ncbi:MAG: hypothetical protein K6U03_11650, partial [Firmicutes bacterium]|nr:hypothetical protein [Bacillota bacterium]
MTLSVTAIRRSMLPFFGMGKSYENDPHGPIIVLVRVIVILMVRSITRTMTERGHRFAAHEREYTSCFHSFSRPDQVRV